MNATYKQMLEGETDENRRAAIEKQIRLNQDEIESLRKEQTKLFGPRTPLKPVTTIIEHDTETKGQKVTVINGPAPVVELATTEVKETPIQSTAPHTKRLSNSLRDTFQAKIKAAKAAKKA